MDRFGFTGEHSCINVAETKSSPPQQQPQQHNKTAGKSADSSHATANTLTRSEKRALKKSIWLENKRSLKWLIMCENWAEWSTKQHKTVKRRVRKGVPDAMRGKMWEVFSGADRLRQRAQEEDSRERTYAVTVDPANSKFSTINSLMNKARALEQEKQHSQDSQDSIESKAPSTIRKDPLVFLSVEQKNARKWDAVIEADLGRTFPEHCMFHRNALGQKVLRDVLRAYAASHPKLGYTQGMNFIAAMFISYMPARDAYWVLTAVMDSPKWDLQSMFCDQTPAVSRIWYQFDKLLAKYLPKVSAHFKQEGMDHSMYLTKWVVPLYTRDFHFDFVVRVWDIFLQQGWKIIFRVALALLKQSESVLLKMDMEEIMYYLRDLPSTIDAEKTLKMAHRIKFKTKELDSLREEFENMKK